MDEYPGLRTWLWRNRMEARRPKGKGHSGLSTEKIKILEEAGLLSRTVSEERPSDTVMVKEIRKKMQELGITTADLATKLGIPAGRVRSWFCYHKTPNNGYLKWIDELSQILKTDLRVLEIKTREEISKKDPTWKQKYYPVDHVYSRQLRQIYVGDLELPTKRSSDERCCLYDIYNKKTQRHYFGVMMIDLWDNRMRSHFNCLDNCTKFNLDREIHPFTDYTWTILKTGTVEEMSEAERAVIKETDNIANGYNSVSGGNIHVLKKRNL